MMTKAAHLIQAVMLKFVPSADRWEKATRQAPAWDDRNRQIGALIAPGSSVLDLGAGAQTLRAHLPANCEYQPCDQFSRTPDTLLCDFNANRYPATTKVYDCVVVSGVMEYLRKPCEFLARLERFGRVAILSYACCEKGHSRLARMRYGWVNHLGRRKLEGLFTELGLRFELAASWENQLIYRLTKSDSMAELTPGKAD